MDECPRNSATGDARVERYLGFYPRILLVAFLCTACTVHPKDYTLYSGYGNDEAQGPWSRFPGVLLSNVDVSRNDIQGLLSIDLLKAMADEFLNLEGATQCDPASRYPIPNVSTEYCSASYVVNTAQDDQNPKYELRLTIPRRNLVHPERSCFPPKAVRDADFPERWITLLGLIHNHPCGRGPSSRDLETWPVDFDSTQGMARLDLYPGNAITGTPPIVDGTPLIVQSYIFARRKGETILLLLRTTGDIHEWTGDAWVWRARCEPDPSGKGLARCNPPFKLHGE